MKYYNTSNSQVLEQYQVIEPVLYDAVFSVVLLFLCDVIGLFGLVANIINIVVFKRQGYKDGVNITLTALATSDIGVLVIVIVYAHSVDPWTDESNLIMQKYSMSILVIYPYEYFIRVSGLITSFAAFQRCLCVLMPLKVKTVLNLKVTSAVNVSIFIALTASFIFPYSLLYVDWKVIPNYNRSFLFVYFRDIRESTIIVHYLVNGICIPFLTMFMLLVFTTILIVKIRSSVTWRKNASNTGSAVNYKERKTVTMLLWVCVIYVVSLVPHSSITAAVGIVKELKAGGTLFDLTQFLFIFSCLSEAVCCSFNIIIYYKMSSKYRQTLWTLMPTTFKAA